MYLLTNGRVITRDEGGKGYYEKGAVAYEGTKIVEVGDEEKFADGNFERVRERDEKILLRACGKGKPVYLGNVIEVNGKRYLPDKEA